MLPSHRAPFALRPGLWYNLPMADTRTYSLTIEPQEGGYLAYFPALPGCHTWGKSFENAVRNAEEALAVYLETLAENGDPLPDEPVPDAAISLGVMIQTPVAA